MDLWNTVFRNVKVDNDNVMVHRNIILVHHNIILVHHNIILVHHNLMMNNQIFRRTKIFSYHMS